MELRNIKSFIKVAEFENFSKAAEVLGYAQSTITLQIQQLEQELGVNLFDRIGKRVLLSEKGRAFLSYANDMVQLEAEAIETVSENTTPTGTLRIGTIESIASSFLPLLLEEYLKKCPQVHLDIIIGVTLELYDQLEKGNLDIIFLADRPAYHPTLKTVFSRPVAVPFIASAEHPLANQKNVPPERLTEETILLTEKNNNYRQIFDELAILHGASFHHTQEISKIGRFPALPSFCISCKKRWASPSCPNMQPYLSCKKKISLSLPSQALISKWICLFFITGRNGLPLP